MKGLPLAIGIGASSLLFAGGCASSPAERPQPAPSGQSTPPAESLEIAVNEEFSSGSNGTIVPASCVLGAVWDQAFYTVRADWRREPDPQPDQPLEGAVLPGCNDTGDGIEPDVPVDAWSIVGVDPERAILVAID